MKKTVPLWNILFQLKRVFFYTLFFSLLINLLTLTVPIYMLQLFDRVLAGHSTETLFYLTLIALFALTLLAVIDGVRHRLAWMSGRWFENTCLPSMLTRTLHDIQPGRRYSAQSLQDVNFVRQYISQGSIFILLDVLWLPLFLLVVFLITPALGVLACIAAVALICLAWLHERLTRVSLSDSGQEFLTAKFFLDAVVQQREMLAGSYRANTISTTVLQQLQSAQTTQQPANKTADVMQSLARYLRMVTQVLMLGLGAYFVIHNTLTPGAMIAASIIGAKALMPLEQLTKVWRQTLTAITAFKRLGQFSQQASAELAVQCVTAPFAIKIESASCVSELDQRIILQDINLTLEKGELLAVVGPSGSGKSSLLRLITGLLPPQTGRVQVVTQRVGYLPQDTALLPGTVYENITCFTAVDLKQVQLATQLLGVHAMIEQMPQGYQTRVESIGLSKGQLRLICLARTFLQLPDIILLDEPEAFLDSHGDGGLRHAITTAKRAQHTVVLVTQRPSLIENADRILVMHHGNIKNLGTPQEVLPYLRVGDSQAEKK